MSKRNFKQPSSSRVQSKFANVPKANIKRSRFNRSHGHKTTFGWEPNQPGGFVRNPLIPVFVDEVLPGDSHHMKSTAFFRLATPLHPTMDNLFLDVHYFFVPYRLVWDNWQKFMGERADPDDDPADYSIPQISIDVGGDTPNPVPMAYLSYYFGLPMACDHSGPVPPVAVNALPFRAYNLIWNEWYRDENLQDSAPVYKGDEPTTQVDYTLRYRGKRKDYFTSALPWPQKGDPVHIPVELYGSTVVYGNPGDDGTVYGRPDGGDYTEPFLETGSSGAFDLRAGGEIGEDLNSVWENVLNAATINDLRTAFQIQKLLERDARGGTRYTELLLSHFGVHSPDARLQRPEYLGGGTARLNMAPVPSTGGVQGGQDTGELGAYATAVNTAKFSKSFTEHGIIIGLCSYRSDLTYQRGIERMWRRETRYDFFWPSLAHLGEQAILREEINFRNRDDDKEVFGYQERYGEYRYKLSRTSGLFNSDADGSLDSWHYAQDFSLDEPLLLNEQFILDAPPIDRTIAVPDEAYFIADIWFDLISDRPMPTYAVPGFVDHF